MASFHLDHLKNYHRRFCRPSRAPNIHTKQGQNMLEILEGCFEEQNSTESLTSSTPKDKDNYSQSASEECQASYSKSVPVSSRKKGASLPVSAEPETEAAAGSVQSNEVHQKSLSTDAVSKSTPNSNKMSSKKIKGHHGASVDELYLSVGSPVVLLGAKMSVSQKAVSSAGQKRVASVSRSSIDMQSSNREISFKTRKRLNFEDKVILNTAEIDNDALQAEDNIPEGQEGTSSEVSRKRDDLSSEVQPQSRKSFSELFLETVKRKSKSSFVVRHTAAVPPPPSPNHMKLLEDEFIIDGSDRSFSGQPWVTIPRKGRHLSHHMPSPENSAVPQGKKSREKPHSLSSVTVINNAQTDKAPPVEEAQFSVGENLGTTWTNELENNCDSSENGMYSDNAKKASTQRRTVKRKPNVAEELTMGRRKSENGTMSKSSQDKFQINSEKSMEDCEEVRIEPIPKKHTPALENKKKKNSTQTDKEKSGRKCFSNGSKNKFVSKEVTLPSRKSCRVSQHPSDWWMVKPNESSVDGNSSKENESSVVYPKRKKQTKRNHVSENTRKKPFPSKRQKTEISSKVQKSLNVKGSGGSVSAHDDISSSQRKPLKNIEGDPTQKSLNISRRTRSSKYQKSVITSQSVHLKSHTEEYTSKTPMESTSDSEVCKHLVWEESGPSSFKNCEMPRSNNSGMSDKKDQKSLGLKTRGSNMIPDRNLHHKLVFGRWAWYGTPLANDSTRCNPFLALESSSLVGGVWCPVEVFYVNSGDLLCTLHETPYMITTGDSFYVPSGNHYNIKNLLNVESCLLFTQIKR
ncbi:centromere protein C [Grammomys surdaster]|uniref:centromere protein C n=1 Tax=Grammomys surdaster TaxID=491861 RepID=UPI00109F37D4|nr:centromere protein C [Grammomys surdaster]